MNSLKNNFLENDWSIQGRGRESFNQAIKEMNDSTETVPVETGSIAIGHYLQSEMAMRKLGYMRFMLFSDGFRFSLTGAKPLVVGIEKSRILETGISKDFICDIIKSGDVLQVNGQVVFAGKRAVADLAALANLKGENMMVPTLERAALISRFLPAVKKVACVVRHSCGLSRCFAVRAATFTPYTTKDLMSILDGIQKVMVGRSKTDMEWCIDHEHYTATMLLPTFELSQRKNFGLQQAIPFIEIQDSSIGDSSFTVRTGVSVYQNKIILEEKGWNHNSRESQVDKIVATARDTLAQNLRDFVNELVSTAVSFPKAAYKKNLADALDFIYKECEFKDYLGKEMWETGREKTIQYFTEKHEKQKKGFTGAEIVLNLYRHVETKTARNMRAMAAVPKAMQKWFEKNGILGQLTFESALA